MFGLTKRRGVRIITMLAIPLLGSRAALPAVDFIAPFPPTALVARVATCGQVDLTWNAGTDDAGGSGIKAYIVNRNDPAGELFKQVTEVAIGGDRTSFSDTNFLRSSATLTYSVSAQDYSGNKSVASNVEMVTTPACPTSSYEQIVGDAYMEPLAKTIANYGPRTAVVYAKKNASLTLDTWLYIHDDDTNQSSRFLLHTPPSYQQIETDYAFTSSTDFWTLSFRPGSMAGGGGNVLVSQYKLNGSPIPTSAMLVSTKPLGDGGSFAKGLIRLKSGALMVAWNQDYSLKSDSSVDAGFAYRSVTGEWSVNFPVNIPSQNGGNITWSRMSMAQHPADDSIWVFDKRDSFGDIIALHFTEVGNGLSLDWIQNGFISQSADGANGPQGEFPYLSAIADPTRNAIMLAYQTNQSRIVYIDQYNGMNGVFLKEAMATVAQIGADGSKMFIPFPAYMERDVQFGFSVLPDGTLWLAYPSINAQSLTWNEVYARSYFNNVWSDRVLVGFNYADYSSHDASGHGDPGFLASRTNQAQVAFRTPDVKVHTLLLSSSAPPPPDTVSPTTTITSPTDGAVVSGMVTVQATASDNTGVTQVDLLVDGVVKATKISAPYTFVWDTSTASKGGHTLRTVARDMAGNVGNSALVSSTVAGDNAVPSIVITNPLNGTTVQRNTILTVTATATDDVGISAVEFYVGNKLLSRDLQAPYAASWKVPAKANSSYTIRAVAYDTSGKNTSATSTVVAK